MSSFRRQLVLVVVTAVGAALAPPVAAQRASTPDSIAHYGHAFPAPAAAAVPRAGAIALDGRLDEPAWQAAPPITGFLQTDPNEGQPATQRTEVRILYDAEALYIGARMDDSAGRAGIATRLVRRDADMESDWFQVILDAYHDHLGNAIFQVNPSGVRYDAFALGNSSPDPSWDPVWEAAAHIDSLGWSAELRIPFSQLRYARARVQTWGLQLRRYIQRRHEQDQWAFWRKTDIGGPARFGHLEGLQIPGATRHVELVPYVLARAQALRPAAAGDPFHSGSARDVRVGGDVKAVLGSNLTLDATFDPDFGQVEVDPAVINLSAFETYFPEKRPFFVAGAGAFDFGNFSCFFCSNVSSVESFYSRRIGRAPQGADLAHDAGAYADIPDASTILGAAKLTGRTRTGISVGVLDAVTQREMARVATSAGERFGVEVEPLTNYFVGRVRRDLHNGDVVIGGLATSVLRRLDDDSLRNRLTAHAEELGADLSLTWGRKTYDFLATAELSQISGDPAAILRAQRSSARYYQRPDRRFAHGCFLSGCYDSTATQMRGLAAYARLAKDAGRLTWEASVNTRTPGFEVNDIALLNRADYIWQSANVAYNWTVPTAWYRTFYVLAGGQQQFTWDGIRNDRQEQLFVASTTPQFWSWSAYLIQRPQVFDERLLRGGPTAIRPSLIDGSVSVSTDARRALVLSVTPEYGRSGDGGYNSYLSVNAHLKPAANLALTFGPTYRGSATTQQYVEAVADPTVAPAFAGTRHVLASIEQRTLSLDTRLAMTFTPTATLELYVQPFIASGHYTDFKELAAPRQARALVYGRDRGTITPLRDARGRDTSFTIDPDGAAGPAAPFTIANPDFRNRSLRGNAVFRWEYRPGSTLYLVWTQSRTADAVDAGDFRFGRDAAAIFAAPPENIFLVKLSYWLGL